MLRTTIDLHYSVLINIGYAADLLSVHIYYDKDIDSMDSNFAQKQSCIAIRILTLPEPNPA